METVAKTKEELEADVLEAAARLVNVQVREIKQDAQKAVIEQRVAQAKSELANAELSRDLAEEAVQNLKYQVMVLQRKVKENRVSYPCCKEERDLHQARLHLWSVGMHGDAAAILAAAYDYGAKTERYYLEILERNQLESNLEEVLKQQALAKEACMVARKNYRCACRALKKAEGKLHSFFRDTYVAINPFAAEQLLANMANVLTNTVHQRYAYSYIETKDLGLTLPAE